MIRNAPDTEETKNMIYPECIKIITHLLKALLPPCKTIFTHFITVKSREAPVLSYHCKINRRGTSLHIHMKKFRMLPSISPITICADRDITFYNKAIIMCILCSLL